MYHSLGLLADAFARVLHSSVPIQRRGCVQCTARFTVGDVGMHLWCSVALPDPRDEDGSKCLWRHFNTDVLEAQALDVLRPLGPCAR